MHSLPMPKHRGPGRPPKLKSDASLTCRLTVLISADDRERVKFVRARNRMRSDGELVRTLLRSEYEKMRSL